MERVKVKGRDPQRLLVFELDEGRYALPLDTVVAVVSAVAITPLPEAPPLVEGVIGVRGRVVPVLNVRGRFGRPSRPLVPQDHMILARTATRLYALRVDRARELIELPCAHILDADEILSSTGPIAGVARSSEGLILIHDLEVFLSAADEAALDAAMQTRD